MDSRKLRSKTVVFNEIDTSRGPITRLDKVNELAFFSIDNGKTGNKHRKVFLKV